MLGAVAAGVYFFPGWQRRSVFDELYRFPKDTLWIYRVEGSSSISRTELRVTSVSPGEVRLEERIYGKDGRLRKIERKIWSEQGEFLVWAEEDAPDMPRLRVFQRGAEPGASWRATDGPSSISLRATYRGRTRVSVPQGTFEAVDLRFETEGGGPSFEIYLAPGIGPVRVVRNPGAQGKVASLAETRTLESADRRRYAEEDDLRDGLRAVRTALAQGDVAAAKAALAALRRKAGAGAHRDLEVRIVLLEGRALLDQRKRLQALAKFKE